MDQVEVMERLRAGLAHHQGGRADEADRIYRAVLAVAPANADALHLLGVLEAQRGRADSALPLLRRAVAAAPQLAEFHRHLGEVEQMAGRRQEALQSFARALQIDPNDVSARTSAGAVLLELGQLQQAAEQFRIIALARPDDALAQGNWGHMLMRLGRVDEAAGVLQHACVATPDAGALWMQYAEAIWRSGRYDEAVALAQHAAQMLPDNPQALLILGNTLQTVGMLEEAERAYRHTMELDPRNFDAHSNLALTLLKMGQAQTALKLYDEILARWPGQNDAKANRSLALLTLGDFDRGLAEYEARWSSPHFAGQEHPGVRWDGVADVRRKTVLLTSEQGRGDTIQFVRYASLLADRGATVIVSCPSDLAELVKTVRGVSKVAISKEDRVTFDVFAPLASMPRLMHTTIATIPADVPYVRADDRRVAKWRERFANDPSLKVGIAWSGSPQHQNDKVRSARFADFAQLFDIEGLSFYSLQKGPSGADLNDKRVTPLAHELTDYSDTAALLEAIDLIISVDTSVVHLAGALARPVWTLLARGPDWRWMLDRDDSPWYPTMRLFRQTKLHDWTSVIQRVAAELRTFKEKR